VIAEVTMKVYIDATVFEQPASGMAKATLGLYNACRLEDPSITAVALHRKRLANTLPSYMSSVGFGGRVVPESVWRSAFVPLYVLKERPAYIHFPMNGSVPSGLKGTPVVSTIHDVLPLEIPGYFKDEHTKRTYIKTIQDSLDRSGLVITDSEYSRARIMSLFKARDEPRVIYLGSTLADVPAFPKEDNGRYFIYVGGYDRRKSIDRLVKVFLGLHRRKMLSSKLVLTGKVYYYSRELKELIDEGRRLGIVEEMGYVPDGRLKALLSGAIALAYPSKYEGFGLPPLEAMASGCPVITTRGTSIPEICGDAVWYIDPDDDGSFADGLVALETDEAVRRELHDKGLKQAAKYSWSRSAKAFLAEISKLRGEGGK
jgi:glycosyltransferase involved in cell wall biosynthesis